MPSLLIVSVLHLERVYPRFPLSSTSFWLVISSAHWFVGPSIANLFLPAVCIYLFYRFSVHTAAIYWLKCSVIIFLIVTSYHFPRIPSLVSNLKRILLHIHGASLLFLSQYPPLFVPPRRQHTRSITREDMQQSYFFLPCHDDPKTRQCQGCWAF